ncbi:SDR family NAD(P)-dependent oxidoreductase [Patescibacteria group bacterium]|nr:SDR family NAD(P)-dependent oxidoreductase [Patescibacteria group bacterium]
MEIKDKVIVITGASQGIGRAAALQLAEQGARLVLAARSADALTELAKSLPDAIAVPTDMIDPAAIRRLIEKAVEQYGKIDILINNAGKGMYGSLESIQPDQYREIMDLNVFGPLIAMQEVIPHMRAAGGGMIINVSSRVSKNFFPNLSAYASTKYALNALSLTAREELKPDHIVVSVLHPKMTATDFGKNAFHAEPFRDVRPGDRAHMPVDTAEDVARKLLELIRSEDAEAEL